MRCKMFDNKIRYYEFISLGENCLTKRILVETGLMRSHSQGQLSYPFDLCVTYPEELRKILLSDFEGYLENIQYMSDNNIYWNNKYNIFYHDDKDCANNQAGYEQIIARYDNRIKNFKNVIKQNTHKFFILNSHCSSNTAINLLYETLSSIYENNTSKFDLILLDLNKRFQKHKLNQNIIYIKQDHPFDDINNWYKAENLSKFNDYKYKLEQDICHAIRSVGYTPIYYTNVSAPKNYSNWAKLLRLKQK